MSKQTNSKTIKTSIGGQAVIEGVMMRGPKLTALSVRMPDQSISTETWDTPTPTKGMNSRFVSPKKFFTVVWSILNFINW